MGEHHYYRGLGRYAKKQVIDEAGRAEAAHGICAALTARWLHERLHSVSRGSMFDSWWLTNARKKAAMKSTAMKMAPIHIRYQQGGDDGGARGQLAYLSSTFNLVLIANVATGDNFTRAMGAVESRTTARTGMFCNFDVTVGGEAARHSVGFYSGGCGHMHFFDGNCGGYKINDTARFWTAYIEALGKRNWVPGAYSLTRVTCP
jgi:hypothetical protein